MRVIALLALAACSFPEKRFVGNSNDGGTDGASADGAVDGRSIDAMPDGPRQCSVASMFPALTMGTQQVPVQGDLFYMTPNNETFFGIATAIEVGPPQDVIQIVVMRPQSGFAPGTYQFETMPNQANNVLAALLGDYDPNTSSQEQMLFASNGSITFTAIGETSGSAITGSVSMTNFREVDEGSGADVPNGCTSQLNGIQFYLQQQ